MTTALQVEAPFERLLAGEGERAFPPAQRRAAIEHFREVGLPTTDQEEWQYTNVAPLASLGLEPAAAGAVSPEVLSGVGIDVPGAARLVFVNGQPVEALSSVGGRCGAARCGSGAVNELVARYAGELANVAERPFAALNTALAPAVAWVRVGEREDAGIVHIIHVTDASRPIVTSPRVLIVAERNARITVIESYHGRSSVPVLTNAVTELFAGENAIIEHVRIQDESDETFHIGSIDSTQARDSRVHLRSFSFGGRVVRNEVRVVLDGDGAECDLDGLYVLSRRQHCDNHTLIDHAMPHTTSRELYKGVLGGQSRGIFDGKIIVRKDAQKISSGQVNKNLLLSNDAIADSKPQLEIHADDVKCSHGSTIGQLDETAVFYLQSRGIGVAEAREMLTVAFAGELIDRVRANAVHEQLTRLLADRLRRAAGGAR